jgi:hypothetical protein
MIKDFSKEDIKQIEQQGLSLAEIKEQITALKKEQSYVEIDRAAALGDGIRSYSEGEIDKYINLYEKALADYSIVKFVPASGAATRMFKSLQNFYNTKDAIHEKATADVKQFFEQIKDFAFYRDLENSLQSDGFIIDTLLEEKQYHLILEYFLTEKGLHYAAKPKALLQFHSYPQENRTAMEEHLVEAALYATDNQHEARLHFTISKEHEQMFKDLLAQKVEKFEKRFSVKYKISYSFQKTSTDQVALDLQNELLRDSKGQLVFRPGGHGALIHNLNDIDADIVFIKNIDNLVKDSMKDITVRYKKLLGGVLLEVKKQMNDYLERLNEGDLNDIELAEMKKYIKKFLGYQIPDEIDMMEEVAQYDFYYSFLDRPIRVCGMVRNEGEPGGGPFWVEGFDFPSLQIVESSQINLHNPDQKRKFQQATHFNPVDLVCFMKDKKGKNFDLLDFIDNTTDFITIKSKDGKELKARELPGLWNGAMAEWITLFVEVPIETFNPVKTINDLLRPAHAAL